MTALRWPRHVLTVAADYEADLERVRAVMGLTGCRCGTAVPGMQHEDGCPWRPPIPWVASSWWRTGPPASWWGVQMPADLIELGSNDPTSNSSRSVRDEDRWVTVETTLTLEEAQAVGRTLSTRRHRGDAVAEPTVEAMARPYGGRHRADP